MELVEITFDGIRIVPWFFRPDGEILERLEWLTDVIQSFDAGEQRIRLRGTPRRYFEFAATLTGRQRRAAENALHDWQGRAWGLPVWMDSQLLAADLTAGATTIAVDTTTRDFRAGGLMGIASDPLTFEVLQIQSMTTSSVTIAAPLAGSWPAGRAEIFPIRAARMPDDVRLRRFDGDTSYGRLRFECTEASDWPTASETAYRGLPVLTTPPNWTEDVEQGFLRKIASIDPGTGPVYFDDEAGGAVTMQSHRWLLDGRAQIDGFRRWLYSRKGRLSSFWLPTFAQDFLVVAGIGNTALTIDVEHCGYTDSIAQDIGRRDIRIELHTGQVYYRRITSSAEVSATVERLSIDSALGATITPAQIRAVSYMAVVRLDADAAEIAWSRWDVAEAALMTRGSRNDL
jgi:hypothetical protein